MWTSALCTIVGATLLLSSVPNVPVVSAFTASNPNKFLGRRIDIEAQGIR